MRSASSLRASPSGMRRPSSQGVEFIQRQRPQVRLFLNTLLPRLVPELPCLQALPEFLPCGLVSKLPTLQRLPELLPLQALLQPDLPRFLLATSQNRLHTRVVLLPSKPIHLSIKRCRTDVDTAVGQLIPQPRLISRLLRRQSAHQCLFHALAGSVINLPRQATHARLIKLPSHSWLPSSDETI